MNRGRVAQLAGLPVFAALVVACSGPATAPVGDPTGNPTPVIAAQSDAGTTTTTQPSLPPLTPVGDGGTTVAPTGACAPATSVTPPTAQWKAPLGIRRNQCSPMEASAIVACRLTGQRCNEGIRPTCNDCAVSLDSAPYAAALIVNAQNQVTELNVEGCVAGLTNDLSVSGCGPKLQARFACAETACTACQDPAQRTACLQAADTGACNTQNQAAACATPVLSQCIQGNTQVEVAFNLIKVFCGP